MSNPLENNLPSQESDNQTRNTWLLYTVSLLAGTMILSGLFVMFYLMAEMYSAFKQPSAYPFLFDIKQAITNKALFSQEGSPAYMIGEGGATVTASVISILFASLIMSVAIGLIRAGAQILSPELGNKIQQLQWRVDVLTKKSRDTS